MIMVTGNVTNMNDVLCQAKLLNSGTIVIVLESICRFRCFVHNNNYVSCCYQVNVRMSLTISNATNWHIREDATPILRSSESSARNHATPVTMV